MSKRICPRCGSKQTAKILWGMPSYDENLQKQLDNKEITLGGCCITENNPTHHCFSCENDFGKSTSFMEVDVVKVEFLIGGYFQGHKTITFTKADKTDIPQMNGFYIPVFECKLAFDDWKEFIKKLHRCYIIDWEKQYVDENVLDGEQWELKIEYGSNEPLFIYGSNAYPPHFDKLKKVIREVVPTFWEQGDLM